MTESAIRNAIWDFDGTLFDTYPAISAAFLEALADFGASSPLPEIDNLARIEVFYCASELAARFNLPTDDLISAFGKHYVAVPLAAQPPFPGVKAVCEKIVATGGVNAIVTHRNTDSALALLDAHGMRALFAEIITRDDCYPRKPDPAAFQAVLKNQRLVPSETLSIGDRDIDILAGQAAGTRTCLFCCGPSKTPADLTICNFAELLEWLDGHGAPG